MKDVTTVKRNITDSQLNKFLEECDRVLSNPYATPAAIETMLRRLYFSNYHGTRIVDMYNKLERKWKNAVNYKTNETHVL